MRGRIFRALQGESLSWDTDRQTQIDVLTAFGMTDRIGEVNMLGGVLLTLKGALHSKSTMQIPGQDLYAEDRKKAVDMLASVVRFHKDFKRIKDDRRRLLAALAITETLNDQCPVCNGAGAIKTESGVVVECQECNGVGKRRFDDGERFLVIYEDWIREFAEDPKRATETKAENEAAHKELLTRMRRDYAKRAVKQLFLMHAFLSWAMADKTKTVALMLEAW